MNDGRIFPMNGMLKKLLLERKVSFVVFREDQQSCRIAIQTMNEADLRAKMSCVNMLAHECQKCLPFFAGIGRRQKPGGLVRNKNVVVFINDCQVRATIRSRKLRGGSIVGGQSIGNFDRLICGSGYYIIYSYSPRLN